VGGIVTIILVNAAVRPPEAPAETGFAPTLTISRPSPLAFGSKRAARRLLNRRQGLPDPVPDHNVETGVAAVNPLRAPVRIVGDGPRRASRRPLIRPGPAHGPA
jgi:hypothetical protein